MSEWWHDLSARERLLLTVAGALVGVLLLSLGIFQPLVDWRAEAHRDVRSARDAYELTAAAAAVSSSTSTPSAGTETPLRQAVLESAGAAGVELIRIGTETEGRLEIQVAPADGSEIFGWLGVLNSHYGVTVAFADITRGEAGKINPQVFVFERK